ncbi:MAG TPA: DUF1598 domain-containing protein [Thermoanaerobaculia bacterium]|nr:DUF1598 domain-containing protein [Thermoanaerobaculia bacterium]
MRGKALAISLLLMIGGSSCSVPDESGGGAASPAAAVQVKGHQPREEPATPGLPLRAVSLRILQQELAACTPKANCPEDALVFGKLSWILGYALDRENRDVLIYGLADPELPQIRVDDFIVALRNSWLKYARLEGNTYEYAFPGCDIRPGPPVVQRLQEVGQQLFSSTSSEKAEEVIRNWDQTCELPQTVSVFGTPFDSHFGHVMVTADYDMKRLADGSDHLDLPGLASIADLEVRKVQDSIQRRQPVAMKANMNRFWLTPGDQVYEEAKGILWIRSSPVQIRTSPIGANANGALNDVTGNDPAAEDFAHRFSVLYDKVAELRPAYRELWSLFQVFSLTQSLHFRHAPEVAGLDLGYLLKTYPVSPLPGRHEVPGRHMVQRFHHERPIPGGTEIIQFWMPSCGGVDMRIEPNAEQFRETQFDFLHPLQNRLRDARPISLPIGWNVSLKEDAKSEEIKHTFQLAELNQPGGPSLVTVEDHGTEYHAFGGNFSYRGLDPEALIRNLGIAEEQGPRTVYVHMTNFSPVKTEAFREDLERHAKQIKPNTEIRVLSDISGTTLVLLFSPGIRIVRDARPAELVREGPLQGLYRAFVSFWVSVGGKLFKVTLTVAGTSAAMVDSFLERLNVPFSLYDSLPFSIIQLIDQTRRELNAYELKYGIRIEVKDEAGKSHSVDLLHNWAERAA